MNKDLHDMEGLFRSKLEGYEEMPSSALKENIDAALDKKETEKYKKRSLIWKRAALLLVLLLAGLLLYESGMIKKGKGHSITKESGPYNDKIPGHNSTTINPDKNNLTNTNTDNTITNQSTVQDNDIPDGDSQKKSITTPGTSLFAIDNAGMAGKKKMAKKNNLLAPDQDPLFPIVSPQTGKNANGLPDHHMYIGTGKSGVEEQVQKIDFGNPISQLATNISLLPNFTVSSLPIGSVNEKKTGKKKFTHFWSMGAIVSYDQAGYKLDSDEPAAITSIKFREANEPSFSAGLLLTRQLANRFSLQSGIIYRNTAIGMKPQKTYAFVDPTGDVAYKYITSSGYAFFKPGFGPQPSVGDSLTTAEAKHTLENISVLLMARYKVLDKKISIIPGAGLEANFVTKANLEVDIEDPFNQEVVIIRKLNGTRSFYCSFIADAEIKYDLNKKVSINVRPVFRYAVSPITKPSNIVETFPHSFGIGAGVTIKF